MENINSLENFRNEIKNLEKTDLVELSNLLELVLKQTWNVYFNTSYNELEKLQIEKDIIKATDYKLKIVNELIKEKDLIKVKVFENDSKEYKIIDCYNPIDIFIISNQYDRYEYLN